MHLSHYSNTQTLFIWVTFTTTCTWEDRITDPIIKENIYSDPYIYELSSSTNADLIIRFCSNGSQSHCHKFSLISLEGLLVKRAKSKPPILTAICTSGFGHTQWVTRRKWTCCVLRSNIAQAITFYGHERQLAPIGSPSEPSTRRKPPSAKTLLETTSKFMARILAS